MWLEMMGIFSLSSCNFQQEAVGTLGQDTHSAPIQLHDTPIRRCDHVKATFIDPAHSCLEVFKLRQKRNRLYLRRMRMP